tara:strand:+ start:196 stop:1014 length:819 start_codon:yes stop_codon:yes gene_type:complete
MNAIQLSQLKEHGFVKIEGVLSKEECEAHKARLDSVVERYSDQYAGSKEASKHGLENKANEDVVVNLHNKDLAFYDLFELPGVIDLVGAALKEGSYQGAEPFCILGNSARSPLPNSPPQQLHIDSSYPGPPFPLMVVVIIMLDDFSIENGATRVVPGSHRNLSYPENGKKYEEEISVPGEAGTVIVFDGSLWHGGGKKVLEGSRWGVILTYGRWWMKPSFDFSKNMPDNIWNGLTDSQKDLLGFRCNPPKDEFTRTRRRSEEFEPPEHYELP